MRVLLYPYRRPCRPQSSHRLAFFTLSKCARAHLEPQRSPCRPQSSHRLAFFALSRRAQAHLEPQRSALPAHPIAADSGTSNCGFQDDQLHTLLLGKPATEETVQMFCRIGYCPTRQHTPRRALNGFLRA